MLGQAFCDHGRDQLFANTTTGRTGAEDGDPLVSEPPAGDGHRREQGTGCNRCGALDVVVEGAEPVAVAIKDGAGMGLREVLPLEQYFRETSSAPRRRKHR